MDDLEAKGLFLVRPPKAKTPPAPSLGAGFVPPGALPQVPRQADLSDWDLFALDDAPVGPLGRPQRPGGLAPERPVEPPPARREPSYRAADLLYDEMAGRAPAEGFGEFARRFDKPVEPPRRAIDNTFPAGVVQLFDRRDWRNLIEGFQRVVPSAPGEPAPWVGLALCAMAQQDVATAAKVFNHAMTLDDDLQPGRFLAEVLSDQPEPWLRLAEELGRRGHLDAALDLCNRVAGNLDHPESLRHRAQKVRRKIRQDFYAERGELDPDYHTSPESSIGRVLRGLATGVTIVALLALAAFAGAKAVAAYQAERGVNELALGVHLLERLRRGDATADRQGRAEDVLGKAMGHLASAGRWDPRNPRPVFLRAKAAALVLQVGLARRPTKEAWKRSRWLQAEQEARRAQAAVQALKLPKETLDAEETAWRALRERALRGEALGY